MSFQLSIRNDEDGNVSRGRISSTGSRLGSSSSPSKPEVSVFIDPPKKLDSKAEKENSKPKSPKLSKPDKRPSTVGNLVSSRSQVRSKIQKLEKRSAKNATASNQPRPETHLESQVSSIENVRDKTNPSQEASPSFQTEVRFEVVKIEAGGSSEVLIVRGEDNNLKILVI